MQIAFSTNTAIAYVLLVRALYGNDSQLHQIERAGARALLVVAERNVAASAENPTGRLASSLKIYRARKGGFGVAANKRGDGNYGRGGTGVRYATPHHQGHPLNDPTRFYYQPTDPAPAVEKAVVAQHQKQWNEVVRRAKVLDGQFGAQAETELRAKILRSGTKFAGGTQGRKAAATLTALERRGTIAAVATTVLPATSGTALPTGVLGA